MAQKTLPDLFGDCYEGEHRRLKSPEEFRKQFCSTCLNAGCQNSKGSDTPWVQRMLTQEDRLLDNPVFAPKEGALFRDLQARDFQSKVREALAIELSTKKGDWSVPTEQEVGQAAAEVLGLAPPSLYVAPPTRPPPPELKFSVADEVRRSPLPPELPTLEEPDGKWKIRGDSGLIYEVVLSKDGAWSCTCPSKEVPCKHARSIMEKLARSPLQAAPSNPEPTRPPSEAPKNFAASVSNTPVPSQGIMIGGAPPPTQAAAPVDPWAPPPISQERVIPVGGKVSFSKK